MFIWDFVADTVLGQIIDWLYGQIVGFLGDFFMQMGSMGADLFEMSWVQSIVLFFSYLAWALYVTGIVVAAFECGIEYQNGRGSIRDTALNVIKGFLAVSLFSVVPVELYKLSVSLQGSFTAGITGLGKDIGTVASEIIQSLKDTATWQDAATSGIFGRTGKYHQSYFHDLSPDYDGVCSDQGVFCQPEERRHPFDPGLRWAVSIYSVCRGDILMGLLVGVNR